MTGNPVLLYEFAENNGIDIDWVTMIQADSLSVMLPDGSCCIALDPWKTKTVAEEVVCLSHELGHCCTGSFYNRKAACDIRQKHENRADKWAISQLVPEEKLETAIACGITEIWDLAEWFGVTEEFMRKAMCWYKNGNLAIN